ncbi:type VI secretion system baseplate subunit TssF [Jiella avicenniae]|uniref:Type VI secretion system baseplate subunit TssF n=1 Tax=Jiella avicenniae TaxID=2907202 RepID=A0A9X1T5V7_9HYPH|nr:type VI secretion system baseplate subunit TssF [Jiella avicenniae]MCE7029259.1 type VI secretion system baseplate subunit TssF [Jiella avicenniae]
MNPALLAAFEEELAILYERAEEFAADFPGVAERLGGLKRDMADPGIKALLEGAAFMAARVQLQLDAEFSTFTTEFLDQLLPGHLEPVPSIALIAAKPSAGSDADTAVRLVPTGSIVESLHRDAASGVACQFRLTSPIALFPLEITAAEYLPSAAAMQALRVGAGPNVDAGLKITVKRLGPTGGPEGKSRPIGELKLDDLVVHLAGQRAEQDAIYEQLFARLSGIAVRHLNESGDPRATRLPASAIGQIGFAPAEALFPSDDRVSPGFALLREFFAFPDKYLGFRLTGLRAALGGLRADAVDLVFEFTDTAPTLGARVSAKSFRLFAAPVVNLFEKRCDRIHLAAGRHEHHVVPDRSALLGYEPHRILGVTAIFSGRAEGAPVLPLHAPAAAIAAAGGARGNALTYTARRLPRRTTDLERRRGSAPAYRGTDLFLSLGGTGAESGDAVPRELAVTALCSNRHLAGELARLPGGGTMRLPGNGELELETVVGPSEPHESAVARKGTAGNLQRGEILWRLIGFLSFNHTGLASHDPQDGAEALRAVLSLYADLSDIATERRLRGILALACRPVTRRLGRPDGFYGARGVEVTIMLDDAAFEGAGVMLLGAVLERLLADLSSVNSFTETVIETPARGVVKRWPPRSGTGPVL